MQRVHLHIVAIIVLATLAAAADAAPKRKRNRVAPVKVAASEAVPAKRVDERVTTAAVTVRKRPGERQAAAGKLAVGTEVVVESEHGRWLRVRAGRISGYVTRTTVSGPRATTPAAQDLRAVSAAEPTESSAPGIEAEDARPTSWRTARERETTKATTSALFATVTAQSAALRSEPNVTAHEVASIAKGHRVAVVDARTTSGWIHVHDGEGHAGWIAQRELGNDPAMTASAVAGDATVRPLAVASATRMARTDEPRRSWSLLLAAGAGYRALASEIESSDAARRVGGSASVARFELDAAAYPMRSVSIGVDAQLDVGRSTMRLDNAGVGAIHGTRGLAAGVRVGIRRELAQLALRAGTRRETVEVLEGTGAPEQLAGTTVGVRLDIAPPRSRFSARLEIDSLLAGTWQHGDAMQSPARAMWAGMTVGVRIMGGVSLHAAFELGRASTAWSEMTMTEPPGARRIDASQLLQVGLSGAL